MKHFQLDQFWREYYQCPEKYKGSVSIEKFLKDFRKTLDPSFQTAKAIDEGSSIEEIIQYAYIEEFLKFAHTLHFVHSHRDILNNLYAEYYRF